MPSRARAGAADWQEQSAGVLDVSPLRWELWQTPDLPSVMVLFGGQLPSQTGHWEGSSSKRGQKHW